VARNRERGWPPAPQALPSPVVDNHTHLDSIAHVLGDGAPVPTVAEHIANAAAVGVTGMVQCGCDLPSARWTDRVVAEHPELVGAIAIHPNEAPLHAGIRETGPDGLPPAPRSHHEVGLDDAVAQIEQLARGNSRIRALGETGMDLFRTGEQGRAVQRESFRAHVALAKELGLALQIHDRDAHREVMDVLIADGAPERTVFHCFSGDAEMADFCAAQGWFLSFAGPVTFNANDELRQALRRVPMSQVMVETDAPYLAPHPFRGRPNAPYLVPVMMGTIAAVKEMPLVDACRAVEETSLRVYGQW
jgi:TatD DNase family protein